ALGRKERIEDFLSHIFRHAGARIGKLQTQAIGVLLNAYRKLAARGHCVDGIYNQVDKDLPQLGSAAKGMLLAFRLQSYFVVQTPQARFVLPPRTSDLDRII